MVYFSPYCPESGYYTSVTTPHRSFFALWEAAGEEEACPPALGIKRTVSRTSWRTMSSGIGRRTVCHEVIWFDRGTGAHWHHHCILLSIDVLNVIHTGVFVGNLPIRLTDLQLLHEVKRAFRRYGECKGMNNRTIVINGQGWPT